MFKKNYLLLMFMFPLVLPTSTWACEAAGPSTHVGQILTTDTVENTFTIFDAQTASPVTFKASENMMKKVVNASGTAFVDFEVYGTDLIATEIVFK